MKKIQLIILFAAMTLFSCSDMMEDFYKNSGADYRTDIYIAAGGILSRSTDSGNSFSTIIPSSVNIFSVVKDEILYYNGTSIISTKGFSQALTANAVASDIYGNFYIQALDVSQNFYKYDGTLKQVSAVVPISFTNLWAVKFKDKEIFYGGSTGGLYYSTDGGINFSQTSINAGTIQDLIICNGDKVFCAYSTGTPVYYSTDSSNFSPTNSAALSYIAFAVDSKNRIYAATNSDIYYSDNGYDWLKGFNSVLTAIADIAVDHNDHLYILDNTFGLHISKDRGLSAVILNPLLGSKLEIVSYQKR